MPKRSVIKNRNDEQEQPQQKQRAEEEQQQSTTSNDEPQPPKKMTQFLNGQQKEYHYRTSVKSYEELDKFRFQVIQKL
jgi:hypothetical protein